MSISKKKDVKNGTDDIFTFANVDLAQLADKLSGYLSILNYNKLEVKFYFDKKDIEEIEGEKMTDKFADVLLDEAWGYTIMSHEDDDIRLNALKMSRPSDLIDTMLHEFAHLYFQTDIEQFCDDFANEYTEAILFHLLANGPSPLNQEELLKWDILMGEYDGVNYAD